MHVRCFFSAWHSVGVYQTAAITVVHINSDSDVSPCGMPQRGVLGEHSESAWRPLWGLWGFDSLARHLAVPLSSPSSGHSVAHYLEAELLLRSS